MSISLKTLINTSVEIDALEQIVTRLLREYFTQEKPSE